MSIKIHFWLDSGANADSCRTGSVTTDDIGMTDDEWKELEDEAKEEIMKEYAFEKADWGFMEDDE